jgi:hypothetical protein
MHSIAAVLQAEEKLTGDHRSLLLGSPADILGGVGLCIPLPPPLSPSHEVHPVLLEGALNMQ